MHYGIDTDCGNEVELFRYYLDTLVGLTVYSHN